jgi:hypothetical protein
MRTATTWGVLIALATAVLGGAAAAAEDAALAGGSALPITYRTEWATYLGGSEYDDLREILVGDDGSLLVGGQTVSPDLPVTTGAFQPRYGGEPAGAGHPGIYGGDCFLARLSADGSRILAATYFGGSRQERDVYGMALDRRGRIVITTTTRSRDIPTTQQAFQRQYAGGEADIVVAKLSADLGRLVWCTYLGGSENETPRGGLAVDKLDNVYVVGTSRSADFPTTAGVLQPRRKGGSDAVVAKLSDDGSRLLWSTLLGGGQEDGILGAQVDDQGNVYLSGHTESNDFPVTPGAPQPRCGGKSDCFLAALAPDASRLLYSTYLGGQGNEFAEHRMERLADGSVLLSGVTSSPDFPATPGAFQGKLRGKTAGFLTKLSADGRKLLFCTFLGGSSGEYFLMPTSDAEGRIYVVGYTASSDFPVTPGALQKTYGGKGDGVFAVLSPDGSRLLYATYLGGPGEDLLRSIALGNSGEVYLLGKTESDQMPVTAGAAQPKRKGGLDGFVVKLARVP